MIRNSFKKARLLLAVALVCPCVAGTAHASATGGVTAVTPAGGPTVQAGNVTATSSGAVTTDNHSYQLAIETKVIRFPDFVVGDIYTDTTIATANSTTTYDQYVVTLVQSGYGYDVVGSLAVRVSGSGAAYTPLPGESSFFWAQQ